MASQATSQATNTATTSNNQPSVPERPSFLPKNLSEALKAAESFEGFEGEVQVALNKGLIATVPKDLIVGAAEDARVSNVFSPDAFKNIDIQSQDLSNLLFLQGGKLVDFAGLILDCGLSDDSLKQMMWGTVFDENTLFSSDPDRNQSVINVLTRISGSPAGNTSLTNIANLFSWAHTPVRLGEVSAAIPALGMPSSSTGSSPSAGAQTRTGGTSLQILAPSQTSAAPQTPSSSSSQTASGSASPSNHSSPSSGSAQSFPQTLTDLEEYWKNKKDQPSLTEDEFNEGLRNVQSALGHVADISAAHRVRTLKLISEIEEQWQRTSPHRAQALNDEGSKVVGEWIVGRMDPARGFVNLCNPINPGATTGSNTTNGSHVSNDPVATFLATDSVQKRMSEKGLYVPGVNDAGDKNGTAELTAKLNAIEAQFQGVFSQGMDLNTLLEGQLQRYLRRR